ncbi:hypothetical protein YASMINEVIRUS_226 [Yasminevirus sp. GU-2018]|uniref:Uncharacterized protein n=1 Tax=Yasminevirus sp. GU-2018 TaxID=2420051 RepID=A0A5K0U8U0_9VIRU|nr:hypothetical protein YASMINEVIRUS_226 [Yasminevirus sp. GU-2018]
MTVYTIDLQDTLDLVRVLERYYRRKNNFSVVTEVVRYFNIVSLKEFIGRHNVQITSRPYAKFGQSKVLKFTVEMDDETAMHLLIDVVFNATKTLRVFAPVIYYMFPAIHRVGRMIIYKKKNSPEHIESPIKNTLYLVHRSNYRNSPLDHPGGHIEYIETSESGELLSGVTYMKYVISTVMNKVRLAIINSSQFRDRPVKDQFDSDLTQVLLTPETILWIYAGTCREVHEESGLRISTCAHSPVLFKLGSKTHYFCCAVPSDTSECGPSTKFRGEIYIEPEHKQFETKTTLTKSTLRQAPIQALRQTPRQALNSLPTQYSSKNPTNRFAVLSECPSDDDTDTGTDPVDSLVPDDLSDSGKDNLTESNGDSDEQQDTYHNTRFHQLKSHKSGKTNSPLNEFWSKVYNRKTHHAWISAKELVAHWDTDYLPHIEKVVAIAEEP